MAFVRRSAPGFLALLVAAALTLPASATENVQLIEQKIKAGLLYNFLKYTQWPAGSGSQTTSPLTVCLFGGDPFDGHLKPMAGRTVNQRVIEIRSLQTADDTAVCSLIFIRSSEKSFWPQLQKRLVGKDVLTVSDFEGFAAAGGMIEFMQIDNRIGVNVNTDAIATTHLEVQDRLLKLASTVRAGAAGR